jgi:hypothetical protein
MPTPKTQLLRDPIGPRPDFVAGQPVKPRERSEIVPHGQEQLHGRFLNDDGDVPPDPSAAATTSRPRT